MFASLPRQARGPAHARVPSHPPVDDDARIAGPPRGPRARYTTRAVRRHGGGARRDWHHTGGRDRRAQRARCISMEGSASWLRRALARRRHHAGFEMLTQRARCARYSGGRRAERFLTARNVVGQGAQRCGRGGAVCVMTREVRHDPTHHDTTRHVTTHHDMTREVRHDTRPCGLKPEKLVKVFNRPCGLRPETMIKCSTKRLNRRRRPRQN